MNQINRSQVEVFMNQLSALKKYTTQLEDKMNNDLFIDINENKALINKIQHIVTGLKANNQNLMM